MARRGGDKTTLDATTPSPFDRSIGPQCKVIHVHGARAVKDRQNVHHRPFTRRSGPQEERKFSMGCKMNCPLPVARLTIKVTYTCHVEKCLYVARHVRSLQWRNFDCLPSADIHEPLRKIFERSSKEPCDFHDPDDSPIRVDATKNKMNKNTMG